MAKTAAVTISVAVTVEVPKSWTEEDLFDKVTEAMEVNVKSSNKKVIVLDVDHDVDEVEEQEEED